MTFSTLSGDWFIPKGKFTIGIVAASIKNLSFSGLLLYYHAIAIIFGTRYVCADGFGAFTIHIPTSR
jgi:hypothetical protein